MNLNDFLVWLGTGGSVIAVSFILERIAWFQNFTSETKQWVTFLSCSVLACGATAINLYVPQEVLTKYAPFYAAVAAVFVAVFISKAFHFFDKKPSDTNVTVVTNTSTSTSVPVSTSTTTIDVTNPPAKTTDQGVG